MPHSHVIHLTHWCKKLSEECHLKINKKRNILYKFVKQCTLVFIFVTNCFWINSQFRKIYGTHYPSYSWLPRPAWVTLNKCSLMRKPEPCRICINEINNNNEVTIKYKYLGPSYYILMWHAYKTVHNLTLLTGKGITMCKLVLHGGCFCFPSLPLLHLFIHQTHFHSYFCSRYISKAQQITCFLSLFLNNKNENNSLLLELEL